MIPFFKTLFELNGMRYQFTSHSNSFDEHQQKWEQNKPIGYIVLIQTGLIFDSNGRLINNF